MKPSLLLILWLLTSAAVLGQDPANGLNAVEVAAASRELFAAVRSDVASALEEALKSKRVGHKELDALLAALNAQSNRLHQAAFTSRLDLAAQQVERVRTQALTLLKDPANKAMAARLDPQEWLDLIALQRSAGTILEGDLARLADTLAELRRWSSAEEAAAPPDAISNGLKGRLAELLNEWRASVGQASSLPPSSAAVPVKSTRLSPPAAEVLKLAESGAAQDQILTFIERCPSAFALDADAIIYIRGKVSSAVICRMLAHDGATRGTHSGPHGSYEPRSESRRPLLPPSADVRGIPNHESLCYQSYNE